ncbi:endonuclease/exonuclease/phosphatase family protein [Vibrio europaeus]|uniref:endonuclease/exonuclease/phosphatase family protein n=1 Tax=Vibrio europaeus TaxID=300876 RepID=UPI00233E797A|nr:endonuclease/exonuclease/phosphatase family protein [Vibrio europaeus]MDC5856238.1 endonuclease/exonuclease/phosphatase family protein [Vibrio europaeus]
MKKSAYLIILSLVLSLVVVVGHQSIFSFTQQAQIASISGSNVALSLQCYRNQQASVLDNRGQIKLLVWNIYKQNRENWQQSLTELSDGKQLVLLQEASMTPELINWVAKQGWFGSQVDAFKAFDTSAGVLNLSLNTPSKACAYTELEPWLRLPKSALYALYPLSSGEQLAVVNIHAVNFTYGTTEYHRQLTVLTKELSQHHGPIIVAGDFNSWSEERFAVMSKALISLGLEEVDYQPDNRTQFVTGLPLDHVFYRGLTLETAEAPISDASDHNPILVSFRLAL